MKAIPQKPKVEVNVFYEIGQYGFFFYQNKILIIHKMLLGMILPSFHKKRSQFIQPWDMTIFKVHNTKNVPHRTLNFVAINYHCYLLKFIEIVKYFLLKK